MVSSSGAVGVCVGGGGGPRARVTPPPYRMSRGPIQPAFFTFFRKILQKTRFFYQICQMKWPKSEEKIEMGGGGWGWGLEKLGGLRMVWPSRCKCLAAPLVSSGILMVSNGTLMVSEVSLMVSSGTVMVFNHS